MPDATYRPYEPEREMDAVVRIMSHAFGSNTERTQKWIETVAHVGRVHEDAGRVRGGLFLYPMGQWFGGRSVPMWGVAAVGIDAQDRGRGVGTQLMESAVREMHSQGIALSTLYAAVQPLYRRAGYERAGCLYVVDADLEKIAPVDRAVSIRTATETDEPVLEALERERASANDGNVDRDAIMWARARAPGGQSTEAHVVEEDAVATGFVRLRHTQRDGRRGLSLTDVVAATPGAARRLLAFLADHASQTDKARWLGHPTGPLQTAADSLCFDVKVGDVWMLRLTHVENALSGRGYPRGLTAEVHLDLTDELCPGNAVRFLLRVDGGNGTVERGGEGRVAMHVRELASIYTGYVSPQVLRTAQPIAGPDDDLATLGEMFRGGSPWMQDAF